MDFVEMGRTWRPGEAGGKGAGGKEDQGAVSARAKAQR